MLEMGWIVEYSMKKYTFSVWIYHWDCIFVSKVEITEGRILQNSNLLVWISPQISILHILVRFIYYGIEEVYHDGSQLQFSSR